MSLGLRYPVAAAASAPSRPPHCESRQRAAQRSLGGWRGKMRGGQTGCGALLGAHVGSTLPAMMATHPCGCAAAASESLAQKVYAQPVDGRPFQVGNEGGLETNSESIAAGSEQRIQVVDRDVHGPDAPFCVILEQKKRPVAEPTMSSRPCRHRSASNSTSRLQKSAARRPSRRPRPSPCLMPPTREPRYCRERATGHGSPDFWM